MGYKDLLFHKSVRFAKEHVKKMEIPALNALEVNTKGGETFNLYKVDYLYTIRLLKNIKWCIPESYIRKSNDINILDLRLSSYVYKFNDR